MYHECRPCFGTDFTLVDAGGKGGESYFEFNISGVRQFFSILMVFLVSKEEQELERG